MKKITPCLWYDSQAEEAANMYVETFNSAPGKHKGKVGTITRYPKSAEEVSGKPAGSVMTVEFELDGNPFLGLNGGTAFKFSEAVSFTIDCETQEEIDHFWKLSAVPESEQCGWLKDKFGMSWQIVPVQLNELMKKNPEKVTAAFLNMKKFVITDLEKAAE